VNKLLVHTALVAAALVLVAACGGSRQTSPTTNASGETPWQKTALWIEQGDETKPFANGGTVSVGDVNVEVFVAPYPPLREGSIDLYATEQATSRPVEGDGLGIVFDMYMPHGSLRAEALPMGGGHYLVPYKLVMPGEWRVDITLSRSSAVAAFGLIFRVS